MNTLMMASPTRRPRLGRYCRAGRKAPSGWLGVVSAMPAPPSVGPRGLAPRGTRSRSWTVTFGETTMPTKPLWPIVTSPAARMACVPPFSMETSPLATSGPQPPLWMVTPPFARTGPHPPFTMERLPSVATSPAPDLVSCRSRALTIPTIDLVTFPSDGNRTAPAALRPCSSMATSAVLIDPEALSLLGRPNASALAAWNLCSLRPKYRTDRRKRLAGVRVDRQGAPDHEGARC